MLFRRTIILCRVPPTGVTVSDSLQICSDSLVYKAVVPIPCRSVLMASPQSAAFGTRTLTSSLFAATSIKMLTVSDEALVVARAVFAQILPAAVDVALCRAGVLYPGLSNWAASIDSVRRNTDEPASNVFAAMTPKLHAPNMSLTVRDSIMDEYIMPLRNLADLMYSKPLDVVVGALCGYNVEGQPNKWNPDQAFLLRDALSATLRHGTHVVGTRSILLWPQLECVAALSPASPYPNVVASIAPPIGPSGCTMDQLCISASGHHWPLYLQGKRRFVFLSALRDIAPGEPLVLARGPPQLSTMSLPVYSLLLSAIFLQDMSCFAESVHHTSQQLWSFLRTKNATLPKIDGN